MVLSADQIPVGLIRDKQLQVVNFSTAVFKWNNGMVEGHVNRLKFLKRSMYGRANFDLLRLRVLHHERCL